MKKIIQVPWYPFFLSAYPVVALLANNITEVKPVVAIRPLVVALAGAGLLFLLLRLIYHSRHRAAFVLAAWALISFSYGPVYDVIFGRWKVPHFTAWMLAAWLTLAVLAAVLAGLRRVRFEAAAPTLNLVSLGLVLFSTFSVAEWTVIRAAPPSQSPPPEQIPQVAQGQALPDIYYIMPEDYGRSDLLQKMDQIDDSQFMQFLKDSGFYVADCSQSNYVSSELSIGSSLNMDYLQNLGPAFTAANLDQAPIWNAIRYNALFPILKQAGYTTVAFATGFSWSELDNADVYISPSPLSSGMNGFETLLLRSTPVRHLEDAGVLNLDAIDGQRYRERTLLDFSSVDRLARMPGPKFVFMQIIAPHPPFVFAPDGSAIDPASFLNSDRLYTQDEYARGFQNEVPYVDRMLEKAITTLIDASPRPPVILLQTDTGPWFTSGSDQFKILNAYYLPGGTDRLYPGISPVNTFRLVLDTYFGASLPLLPDVSYFSPVPHIYDFSEVPNPCTTP